ncbi:MAG TPA: STAS domain-containing protein [bacterium]|nr:STAS domain-containing protein [bacterium]
MDIEASIAANFADYPKGTIHGFMEDHVCTFYLSGSIDMRYAKDLQKLLRTVIDQLGMSSTIIIDMRYVDYISSTGVGAFVTSLVEAKRRDMTLKLRDMQPKVSAIFELLGFLGFFKEAPTHG